MQGEIIALQLNFTDGTVGTIEENISKGRTMSRAEVCNFFNRNRTVADNTFFTVTPVSDFSQLIINCKGITMEGCVYTDETSKIQSFPSERQNIFQLGLASGKINIEYIDNKNLLTAASMGNKYDICPVLLAEKRIEPITTLGYHELIGACLKKIPTVIFLLDLNLRKKLNSFGIEKFKIYLKNKILNKYYGNFKNYRKK